MWLKRLKYRLSKKKGFDLVYKNEPEKSIEQRLGLLISMVNTAFYSYNKKEVAQRVNQIIYLCKDIEMFARKCKKVYKLRWYNRQPKGGKE